MPSGQQVAELVLPPSVQDAVNDLVQIRARIYTVGDACRDNRENAGGAFFAVVELCEEPISDREPSV